MDADVDLVRRTAAGEREAWAELVRRHLAPVRAFAWAILQDPHAAEDVAQEVFLRARSAAGKFEGRSAVRTWLCGIAGRVCLEERRANLRPPPPPDARAAPVAPPALLEAGERLAEARRRFALLPEEDRALLMLASGAGLPPDEGRAPGCSRGAQRVRLCRARARWKALVGDLGGSE